MNAREFSNHPIGVEVAQVKNTKTKTTLLEKFEQNVETQYKEQLYMVCQRDRERKERRKEQKMGFLGIGADWDAIKQIDAERIESCEELRRLGVLV